jgi:hypothetical protein
MRPNMMAMADEKCREERWTGQRAAVLAGAGLTLVALLAAVAATMGGCAAGTERQCYVGADCPSGACRSDGTCEPPPSSNGGGGAGAQGGGGAGGAVGGGGQGPTGGGGSGGSSVCLPNDDGTIEQAEIPLAAGLDAKFETATDATVSTAGVSNPDGSRTWDYSGALPGDQPTLVATLPLAGMWFESSFPGASYAAELSSTSDLLGVFEIGSGELLLRGIVSPTGGLYRTELSYSPAVPVLDFPLTESKSWQITSNVTGLTVGVASAYTEQYAYEVDAHGDVVTPFGTFHVLRLRSTLTRTVGMLVTVVRSFLFVTECFGTVASVTSQDNESNVQFEDASEVRRLTP